MKASKHVLRVRRHHARHRGSGTLNIVPMIDMMVILVFFLIFTAVFSKTNILELNLPSDQSVPELPQGLQLEVIVRDGDHRRGGPRHRAAAQPPEAGRRL